MSSELIFSTGECRTSLSDTKIADAIAELAKSAQTDTSLTVAQIIRWYTREGGKLGSLLQYSIDVCADEVIGEEFYKKDPTILPFLSVCGTTNEDAKFINYIRSHKDAFACKRPGCSGTLFGECPIMECEECGKQHFVKIDGLTEQMCSVCVSHGLNTCNRDVPCEDGGPSRITTIYMV